MARSRGFPRWPNLVAMLFDQAERHPKAPMVWRKIDGAYRPWTWQEVADAVRQLAAALRALGIGPEDRVVLVADSRPEWLIADLAIMAAGAWTVPAYTTNTVDDHRHILANSGAKAAIVGTPKLFTRLWAAAINSDQMQHVIAIDPIDHPGSSQVALSQWADLMALDTGQIEVAAETAARLERTDVACIIYTSGTSGAPRGVMQTHGGILTNCEGAYHVLRGLGLGDEVFLSFLPLSHSYEHSAGQFFPVSIGAEIYYAESIDTLVANMAEVRPTIMTAVPRLYEVIHQRILRELKRQPETRRKALLKAVELGTKRYRGDRLGLIDWLIDWLLDRLVRAKVADRFGGRLKAMVSGGAPLNEEVGLFFHALGLRILQGYGQTEASPVVAVNLPGRVKLHSVGPPMEGVEVRIAEDGEILVKGELLMKGYWADQAATDRTIVDGWLHTGDIGHLEPDGAIVITDRKKDLIVNSGGDNISPARVEGVLCLAPEIAQAMVIGDRRPYLSALIVPDADYIRQWAEETGSANDYAAAIGDAGFAKRIDKALALTNQSLSSIERVRKYIFADEPLSVENGQLTPTMKIRRHRALAVYGDRLDGLYRDRAKAS